jgi:hypothetical protein
MSTDAATLPGSMVSQSLLQLQPIPRRSLKPMPVVPASKFVATFIERQVAPINVGRSSTSIYADLRIRVINQAHLEYSSRSRRHRGVTQS